MLIAHLISFSLIHSRAVVQDAALIKTPLRKQQQTLQKIHNEKSDIFNRFRNLLILAIPGKPETLLCVLSLIKFPFPTTTVDTSLASQGGCIGLRGASLSRKCGPTCRPLAKTLAGQMSAMGPFVLLLPSFSSKTPMFTTAEHDEFLLDLLTESEKKP